MVGSMCSLNAFLYRSYMESRHGDDDDDDDDALWQAVPLVTPIGPHPMPE